MSFLAGYIKFCEKIQKAGEEITKVGGDIFEKWAKRIRDANTTEPLDPAFVAQHKVPEGKENALCIGAIKICNDYGKNSELILENVRKKDYYLGLWEITDNRSAKNILDGLFDNAVSDDSMTIEPSELELAGIYAKFDKRLKEEALNMNLNNPITIEKMQSVTNLNAWNIERAGYIARRCFLSNFLSEEECYYYLEKNLKLAQTLYQSWDDYFVSFILGDTCDTDRLEKAMVTYDDVDAYLELINDPNSCFIKYPLNQA